MPKIWRTPREWSSLKRNSQSCMVQAPLEKLFNSAPRIGCLYAGSCLDCLGFGPIRKEFMYKPRITTFLWLLCLLSNLTPPLTAVAQKTRVRPKILYLTHSAGFKHDVLP